MRTTITPLCIALALAAVGCGDDGDGTPSITGPYDGIELGQELTLDGLDGPIHIARDEFGIAHIAATTAGDAAFAQGYVMAHDRLPQMDILRRFASGTVAKLFGALDRGAIETDLNMRQHRMRAIATQVYDQMRASSDPDDVALVDVYERFADGINAYHQHVMDGRYELDPATLSSFDPQHFEPWTPVDSLALARFQAFALSFSVPFEVDLTALYQGAIQAFDSAPGPGEPGHDPALFARRGASSDILRLTPIGRVSSIPGFPGTLPLTGPAPARGADRADRAADQRAMVPRHLLDNARRVFAQKMYKGPESFMIPKAGSNNWIVGPDHTDGRTLLAGDQHLDMPNPSIFYPTQLTVDGAFDIEGITFPGIPLIILGHNGQVAWTSTTVFHDVNDVYLETIVPCAAGGGDCVVHDGGEVAIETFTEDIEIGALGVITETRTVTYERVPHHGVIIPTIENGNIVPRKGNTALSIRYTGHAPTFDVRATWGLAHAQSVEDAQAALRSFEYGGQNWLIMDNQGSIGYTSHVNLPVRTPATYAWHPINNPGGVAPFLVMPGTGEFEWEGFQDPQYIPQALNPDQGYIVTANSDPVGATFDGDPLNNPIVDGRPLYNGAFYATGLRTERIDEMIRQRIDSGAPITLDDMADMQHDVKSTFGTHMQPHVVASLDQVDNPTLPDIAAWLATQDPATLDRVREARTYLADWTLDTPAAVQGDPGPGEIRDSVATTLFNVWAHFFLGAMLGDELTVMGADVYSLNDNLTARIMLAAFAEPDSFASGLASTGQPVLCDVLTTGAVVESCDGVALQAMVDALAWLESGEGFGAPDMNTWVWGKLHTLTLTPLIPDSDFNVPHADDPDPALRNGYPRPGDTFVVNRGDGGFQDLDFRHDGDGPAQRFLAEIEQGQTVRVRLALPGGTIYHRESPHYRDLMDEYHVAHRHFDLPYTTQEIVAAGEERWLMRAP